MSHWMIANNSKHEARSFCAAYFCSVDLNDPPSLDSVKTRITVTFLFVLFRVISWTACYAPRKAIHEITRNNTNELQGKFRVLTQSLSVGGIPTFVQRHCSEHSH